jgi:hypothetical protein
MHNVPTYIEIEKILRLIYGAVSWEAQKLKIGRDVYWCLSEIRLFNYLFQIKINVLNRLNRKS